MRQKTLAELRLAVLNAAPPARRLLRELKADSRKGALELLSLLQHRLQVPVGAEAGVELMLAFESEAAGQGFHRVAGVDEAGRGPLAGPIVAAAVILSEPVAGINDSKQLTWEQREMYYERLVSGDHAIGVAIISADAIDRCGIQHANYQAMARAAAQLSPPADYLLVDGFRIPGVPQPQRRIIKGDCRSQSIAAASIIAKVTRDRMMEEYDKVYPAYNFAQHKGYGTPEHMEVIASRGPSPIHRMSFAPMSRTLETALLFEEVEN